MDIGKRLKNRRLELGLSVDEVAKRLGKNRATIYRYENNDIENLPTTVLEPLAKILDTTPAYLMGWDNAEKNKKSEKKLEYIEDLLELCGWSFDEYIECGENSLCPLNKEQKAAMWYYFKEFDCCSNCKYRKAYLYINNGTNFYKLTSDDIELLYDNILNYSGFLFTEKTNKLNKICPEEYKHIIKNAVYSNYNDAVNENSDNLGQVALSEMQEPNEMNFKFLNALNAARERTDIVPTKEMKQHDEDIMNDDNF